MTGIMMLVNEFPPLPVGGAERQAQRLAQYLARRGWDISVVTRRAAGVPEKDILSGVQVLRPYTFGPGKLKTVTYILGALAELWRSHRHYQILHAHLAFGAAFAAVLAARLLRKKVIVKLGSSGAFGDISVSQRTWRGRLRLAAYRRWADRLIVLDDGMRNEAIAAGFEPRRVQKMSNGIDARSFFPSQPASEVKKSFGLSDKVVVLFVGRLVMQKSLDTLVRALAEAVPLCPALHLMLLGDGPERESLEALAKQLKLEPYITFAGNQGDVRPYLHMADMFVLCSHSEGISNAMLEAMSAGVACIASDVGGNPEVLDHGRCGILPPPREVGAWAQAIVALGNDPQRRRELGEAARQRILAEYDFSIIGARYESLYYGLMDANSSSSSAATQVSS